LFGRRRLQHLNSLVSFAAAAGQAIKAQLDIQSIPANGRSAGAQQIRISATLDAKSLTAQGRVGAAGIVAVDTV